MKIIFMGTPEPAASILQELISSQHEIVCVVTQPDRPKGRGQKLTFPPVKEIALKNDLPIKQPEKVKNNAVFTSLLKSLKPDMIVVVAYGKILPQEIIEVPKLGCINVHASLLPKYRGAAPIQWALINGESETGISIMKINERLDAGEIILQKKIKISEADNAITLFEKLFDLGGKLMLRVLEQIEHGTARFTAQDDAQATFAPSLTKESGEIDWKNSALSIHNRIRGTVPWPVTHTYYKEKLLKIWKSQIHVLALEMEFKAAGTIVQVVKNTGFIVSTGNGHILILEVQPEGKKKMGAYEFVIGHKISAGSVLPS